MSARACQRQRWRTFITDVSKKTGSWRLISTFGRRDRGATDQVVKSDGEFTKNGLRIVKVDGSYSSETTGCGWNSKPTIEMSLTLGL